MLEERNSILYNSTHFAIDLENYNIFYNKKKCIVLIIRKIAIPSSKTKQNQIKSINFCFI